MDDGLQTVPVEDGVGCNAGVVSGVFVDFGRSEVGDVGEDGVWG